MKLSTYLTTHSFFESQTLKNKKPLKKRGFKGGPTCTITNTLTYSLSISYKITYYPKGNKIVTFWVINYPVG